MAEVRLFQTGATRDIEGDKPDYEGFISPMVIERYGSYMHKNRVQRDGNLRDSDNWQKGIPLSAYMKSLWRHFFTVWKWHRGGKDQQEGLEDALCGVLFNTMGYLHETLKAKQLPINSQRDAVNLHDLSQGIDNRQLVSLNGPIEKGPGSRQFQGYAGIFNPLNVAQLPVGKGIIPVDVSQTSPVLKMLEKAMK